MRFLALFLLLFVSCALPEPVSPDEGVSLSTGALAQPQGLWTSDDRLYVTNANYTIEQGGVVYGTGQLSVLDRAELSELFRWDLPLKNPVHVQAEGDDLWVLCMGDIRRDDDGAFYVAESGGLVLIPGVLNEAGESPEMESYPLGSAGSAGSWAWLADGVRLVLGSSISPELYVFNVVERAWLRGPDDPILEPEPAGTETLSVAAHPDGHVGVFSFARNTARLLDGETFEQRPDTEEVTLAVGTELEGPLSAVFVMEEGVAVAYVVLSLSNSLARWNPLDISSADPRFENLGLTPNEVRANDTTLFVVESGDNVLKLIPRDGGAPIKVVFPVGTNPYSAALSPDGTMIYVSGLLSNSIYEIDISSPSILRSGPVEP